MKMFSMLSRKFQDIFIDSTFEKHAYTNKAFPIASGQTISQPHTVANQTELLGCKAGDLVLEIGTGSGYQCAVLCEIGMKVHSIERQKELFDSAGPLLRLLGYKPFLTEMDTRGRRHLLHLMESLLLVELHLFQMH